MAHTKFTVKVPQDNGVLNYPEPKSFLEVFSALLEAYEILDDEIQKLIEYIEIGEDAGRTHKRTAILVKIHFESEVTEGKQSKPHTLTVPVEDTEIGSFVIHHFHGIIRDVLQETQMRARSRVDEVTSLYKKLPKLK